MAAHLTAALGALVLASCADAQHTPPTLGGEADPVVVADGRSADAEPPPAHWLTRPAVRSAVDAARAHWTRQDPGYEEEVRLLAVAEGAFTQAGTDQTAVLYLMGLWPRCCPKIGLAVIEGGPGGPLVRNVAFEGSIQGLQGVPDLDADGLDELALSGGFGMGGEWTSSVVLVSFRPSGLESWGGTTLSSDDCAGSGRTPPTAARVLAVPGAPPAFSIERYAQASCDTEAWEAVGNAEPLTLERPDDNPYTDLPIN